MQYADDQLPLSITSAKAVNDHVRRNHHRAIFGAEQRRPTHSGVGALHKRPASQRGWVRLKSERQSVQSSGPCRTFRQLTGPSWKSRQSWSCRKIRTNVGAVEQAADACAEHKILHARFPTERAIPDRTPQDNDDQAEPSRCPYKGHQSARRQDHPPCQGSRRGSAGHISLTLRIMALQETSNMNSASRPTAKLTRFREVHERCFVFSPGHQKRFRRPDRLSARAAAREQGQRARI